jgi:predicted site-specific integrase-resolvase
MSAPEGYYTEEEEAKRLSVALRTLRRWRAVGYGPAITRLGRFIYYSPVAEREFLAKAERTVELPAPRRGRRAA